MSIFLYALPTLFIKVCLSHAKVSAEWRNDEAAASEMPHSANATRCADVCEGCNCPILAAVSRSTSQFVVLFNYHAKASKSIHKSRNTSLPDIHSRSVDVALSQSTGPALWLAHEGQDADEATPSLRKGSCSCLEVSECRQRLSCLYISSNELNRTPGILDIRIARGLATPR